MTAFIVIVKILEHESGYIKGLILNAISFVAGFTIYTQVVQKFIRQMNMPWEILSLLIFIMEFLPDYMMLLVEILILW